MTTEKKPYPLRQIVNWYFGNHCARKCFDKDERLQEHHQKLMLFVEKNPNLVITHRQFLDLFNNHMTLCSLDENFKRRSIGWKLFERLQATPNYDSDLMIIDGNKIKRKDSPLVCDQRWFRAFDKDNQICLLHFFHFRVYLFLLL